MKRFISIFFVFLLLVIGGIYYFFFREQKAVINGTLSARSQEYLKERRNKENTSLEHAAIEEDRTKAVLRNEKVSVGDCFSMLIPFKVWNARKEGDCSMYYAIDNPRGQIVVYQEKQPVDSFDSVPGVSMRRKFPETYSEETKTISGKTFLMFQRKQEAYEKSVFYYTKDSFFVLNLITVSNESLDGQLVQMLESVEFK